MNRSIPRLIAVLACVIMCTIAFADTAHAATGVPRIMNYQGRLMNSGGSLLGGSSGTDYCVKFSLYDNATVGSGTKLWPSSAPSTMTVNVKSGVFNAGVGDTNAGGDTLNFDFESNDAVYLNVEVASKVGATCAAGDGAESFENLSPRQRVTASGYAINSATLGGQTGAYYRANSYSTTSAAYDLSTYDKGYFFSTTSVNYWNSTVGAWATTSSDAWFATKTTDNLPQGITNLYYSNSAVNAFLAGSTTVAKSFTNNSFSGVNNFTGDVTLTNATTSNFNILNTVSGGGLVSCSASSDKLIWNATTRQFGCGADAGAGGGLTALGAEFSSYQTGSSQTLATSSDTNIGITITSSGDTHTFAPTWSGTLGAGRGGTGIGSVSQNGILIGAAGNTWSQVSTSSLGLPTFATLSSYLGLSAWYATTTDALTEGVTNRYYTDTRVASVIAGTTTDALSEGATNKYYTDNRVQTYLNGVDKGFYFSTTSASQFASVGLAFSTTSAAYFNSVNPGASFSTTSASYFSSLGLAYSTTSTAFNLSTYDKGYFFSTTSVAFWDSTQFRWATTSSDAWLATKSTTDLAEGSNLYYTPTRVAGVIAGTTTDALAEGSNNKYFTSNRVASVIAGTTTDALAEGGTNKYYQDSRVASYINGSSTIPSVGGGAYGDILSWNGSRWSVAATSSIGLPTFASLASYFTLASWYATTTDALDEGVNNMYFTPARFAESLAATTTDALAEGTNNLYFSTNRVATVLAATTTDAIAEGSTNKYYNDSRVQTFLNTISKGYFFSTTSASNFASAGLAFSTTSTDYWKSQQNFHSTTSFAFNLGTYDKGYFFSTTSVTYWEGTQSRWATTSSDAWLATKSTSDVAEGINLYFTPTRVAEIIAGTTTDALAEGSVNKYYSNGLVQTYLNGVDKGFFFSTTSAAYYASQNPQSFSTSSANYYMQASSTVPKTYSNNTFTGTNDFQNVTAANATSTTSFAGTASSSNLYSNIANIGSLIAGAFTGNVITATNATTTTLYTSTASSTNSFTNNATIGTANVGSATVNSLTLNNALTAGNGGTGLSTVTQNALLIGGPANTWTQISTSSLGLVAFSDLGAYMGLAQWYATTTDALTEGSNNKYFTVNRVAAALAATTTDAIAEGSTNLYFTPNRVAGVIAGTTTDALAEGSVNKYYSNGLVQTYLNGVDKGFFFSTTSALYFDSLNDSSFSTTSADYWKAQNNFHSTTSFAFNLSTYDKGYFFSTTSVNYWEGTQNRWATTSSDAWLATKSTSDLAEGSNLYYTPTRVAGVIAGTTTDALAEGSNNKYYQDSRVASYINSSSTIPSVGGSSYGDILSWNGSHWSVAATSSIGLPTFANLANYFTLASWYATTTDALDEGVNNMYFTPARVATVLAATTTDAIAEGTNNLYFTSNRVAGVLAATTSDAIAEGSTNQYYTDNRVQSFLNTVSKGYFFSTTSASNFASAGLAFSTTSSNYWLSTQTIPSFSTTSADFWKTQNNFHSTTSFAFNLSTYDKGYFFSTTSVNYWEGTQNRWATTSSDAWLATKSTTDLAEGSNLYYTPTRVAGVIAGTTTDALAEGTNNKYYSDGRVQTYLNGVDKGFYFSTTSASVFSARGLSFSTTSTDYWRSVNNFFSTTSASHFSSLGLAFSTTSTAYFLGLNQGAAFSTTSANYFVDASTTIPKTYTNNTFSGTNSFSNITFVQGTSTSLFANVLSAVSSLFGSFSATSTTATSSISGPVAFGTTTTNYKYSFMGQTTGATGATGTAIVAISNDNNTLSSGNNVLRLNLRTPYATACTSATTCPRFEEYFTGVTSGSDTGGRSVGSLRLSTAGTGITQTSGAADFAEYMQLSESAAVGDIVSLNSNGEYRKATAGESLIGVVSDNAAFVGNANLEGEANAYIVGFAGVIRTTVSTANGTINAGDLIAASDVPGVGIKLSKSGYALGQALESYSGGGQGTIAVLVLPKFVDAAVALESYGGGASGASGYWDLSTSTNTVSLASSTYSVSIGTSASTSNLVVSNGFTFGKASGVLKSVAGVVTSTLVNLAGDVTGVLGISNGGTGTSTAPQNGQVLVGNASGGYDLVAASALVSQNQGNTFSTTSTDYWKTQNNFFSTTSASVFSASGLSFSTTSTDYWRSVNNFFSTTSASHFSSLGLAFSTTSAQYFLGQNLGGAFSTTSTDYWKTQNNFHSTTSTAYNLSTYDKGYFFSTTSASAFLALNQGAAFSTTSAAFNLSTYDKGYFFSTTSVNYWEGTQNRWATTSSDAWLATKSTTDLAEGSNLYYTPTRVAGVIAGTTTDALAQGTTNKYFSNGLVDQYLAASTSVPKTFTNNTFTGTNAFGAITASGATTTALSTNSASTSNLVISTLQNSMLYTGSGGVVSAATISGPLSFSAGTLSIQQASASQNGYLSSSDFSSFNSRLSTSSLNTIDRGQFFSTTSASVFSASGLSFSTTSTDYWRSVNNFFSTTSASHFSALGLAFSTTSAQYFLGQNQGASFSTTSENYYQQSSTTVVTAYKSNTFTGTNSFQNITATGATTTAISTGIASTTNLVVSGLSNALLGTGANGVVQATTFSGPLSYNGGILTLTQSGAAQNGYLSSTDWNSFNSRLSTSTLALIDKGFFFSTTSASVFAASGLAFSTTSTDYWKSQNNFFSTTSASYFSTLGLSFSTTSAAYFTSQNQGASFSTTSQNYYMQSSTTVPTTYKNNTYTGTNSFQNITATGATTTVISTGIASTTNLVVGISNGLLGSGVNGAVQATTFSGPLSYNGGILTLTQSGAAQNGYLSSTDWNSFNSRLSTSTLALFDKGYFFSTSSTDYYMQSSTTVPTTYKNNTFIGVNAFANITATGATTTSLFTGVASSTNLFSTSARFGSLAGFSLTGSVAAAANSITGINIASTTDLWISNIRNGLLATNGQGTVVASSTPTASSFNATSNTASQLPYASTTAISALQQLSIGAANGTILQGGSTGTSTIAGVINVTGTNSTSTFSGGVSATRLNFSATSTGSQGINLTGGCFAMNGVCISGAVNSVSATNTTLTVNPNAGNVGISLNLSNPNLWTGLQQFGNATSSLLEATQFYARTIAATSSNVLSLQGNSGLTFGSTTAQMLAITPSTNRVTLGTGGSNPSLLVLDTKNTAGDPTGIDGSMYFNSNIGEFRCYNGGWVTCGGQAASSTGNVQYRNIDGSFTANAGFTWSIPTAGLVLTGTSTTQTTDLLTIASSTGRTMFAVNGMGILSLSTTTDPVAPPSGELNIYAKEIGGRTVPKWVGPSGVDTPFQAAIWQNNLVYFTPQVAAGVWTGTVGGNSGTPVIVLPTTTNFYTTQRRSQFPSVVTTLNQQVGTRSEAMFFRGGTTGQGGFFFAARVGLETWTAGDRLFVGLSAATATAVCTQQLTNHLNTIGFAINAASTSISLITNDNTGSSTVVTIAGQPALATNNGYAFYLFAKPNDTVVYWQMDDVNTGTKIADGSIATDLPVNTTMMAAHACMSNAANTAANAARIGINRIYIETDR